MNRLKEFREEAMMTVRELSERSGVSEDTITKIENGHRKGRGMTLRKLAKALGVELQELSPEHSERTIDAKAPEMLPQHRFGSFEVPRENSSVPETIQDASILEEAISRVYEVMQALDRPVEKSDLQRGYPDGVLRMNISERQQKVLITVLKCGEVGPSTVADRLEISVGTAYRDLSVLEEHGLVVADESYYRSITPLGRDLVEAIANSRSSLLGRDVGESLVKARDRLSLDEALSQIRTLMKVYDSISEFDPYRLPDEAIAPFFRLQELVIQSIRRIAALIEPPRLADQVFDQVQPDSLAGEAEQKDYEDYAAQAVQSVMRLLMPNPPALSRIREDLEGFTEEQIRETLDIVVTIRPIDYDSYDPSAPYKQFRSMLAFKVGTSTFSSGTMQEDETDDAQHARMRDAD